jgi:hypothetical protein
MKPDFVPRMGAFNDFADDSSLAVLRDAMPVARIAFSPRKRNGRMVKIFKLHGSSI